jgi:hypothetical protein
VLIASRSASIWNKRELKAVQIVCGLLLFVKKPTKYRKTGTVCLAGKNNRKYN